MTTTSFETIYSRARGKMTDLKEVMYLTDYDLAELYKERLYSTLGDARIGGLFSSLEVDEDEETITWELTNTGLDFLDSEFVTEILALGIVIGWLRPQVESQEFTTLMIGGKEEKSLNNQYKNVSARLQALEIKQYKMIRDRGYLHNDYLDGDDSEV